MTRDCTAIVTKGGKWLRCIRLEHPKGTRHTYRKADGSHHFFTDAQASRTKPRQSLKKEKKKLIGVLTPTTGLIPASEGVTRKFLRMTLAERTKFVELFSGFTDRDWKRFRAWIRKLSMEPPRKDLDYCAHCKGTCVFAGTEKRHGRSQTKQAFGARTKDAGRIEPGARAGHERPNARTRDRKAARG